MKHFYDFPIFTIKEITPKKQTCKHKNHLMNAFKTISAIVKYVNTFYLIITIGIN